MDRTNTVSDHQSLADVDDYSFLCKNVKPRKDPIAKADGNIVQDVHGEEYLDFSAQTLNLNLGHSHPRINDAVREQLSELHYTSSRFSDPTTLRLAKRLVEVTPDNLTKVNLKMTGGSLANECAIKMARKTHGKQKIATTYGNFFGETCETMRCSGKYFDKRFLYGSDGFVYFDPPYSEDSEGLAAFKRVVETHDDLAGVILTPIDVNTGVKAFPEEYLSGVRDLCDEHNIALIFDEVQTGFGWLGNVFAADYFGVEPDILTVAKGLSAGFPLGAVVCDDAYDVIDYGEHEFTNGAHPVSCAAALETIDIVSDPDFIEEVSAKADYLAERTAELEQKHAAIDTVRSFGMIVGVDIVKGAGEPDADYAEEIFETCLDRGVIFRLSGDYEGNTLIMKPSLVVSRNEIDTAVETLDTVLQES